MAEVVGSYQAHGTHTKFAAVLSSVTTSSTATTTTITITGTGRHYNNDTHSNTVSASSFNAYGLAAKGGTIVNSSPMSATYPTNAVSVAAGKGKTADGNNLTFTFSVARTAAAQTISDITFRLSSTISSLTSDAVWGSSVTVPAATVSFSPQTLASKTFSTSAQTSAAFTAASGGSGNYSYTKGTEKNANDTTTNYFTLNSNRTFTIAANTPASTYKIGVTAKDTTTNASSSVIIQITIAKASISPTVTMAGWTYGGTATNPSVSGNTGGGTVTYNYKVSTAADSTYTTTKPSNAGTYTVRASIAATTNYNAGTATANFTIAKATPTLSVTGATLNYTGSAQNLATAWSVTGGGTVYLGLGSSSSSAPSSWSTNASPTATNVGTYYLWAKADASTNYNAVTQVYKTTAVIKPVMWLKFHANGGTIADAPHQYDTSNYFKLNNSIVQRSATSTGTFSDVTYTINTSTTYLNVWNIASYNITRTGYTYSGTAAFNTAANGTGIDVNQDNTAAGDTNPITTKRLNGGTEITSNVTKTLYVKWVATTSSVTLNANGGSGGTASVTATYDSAMPSATMPTRTGYTFAGYYDTSATSGGTQYYTAAGASARTWNKTGAQTLYARWTINSYALTVDPNGGTWSSSTSTQSFTQNYATTKAIAAPTRTGYTFVGWAETGPGSLAKVNNTDPAFDSSSGGVAVYNNSGGGTVTHTRQSSSAGTAYGSYEILINATSGTTSPGNGGFYQPTTSAANKKYIHAFVAKVPTGYTVMNAQNATGDGRTITWLTDRYGTGAFRVYAYQHNCGSTGTFSTFGHVYLDTGTRPVSWQLAYSAMKDITDSTADTYTYGAGAGRLTALWAGNKYSVAFNANGGSGSMTTQTDFFYGTAKALTANGFTAPSGGYSFQGWATSAANAAAGTVAYANQANMTTGTTTSGGTVTLYAVWKRTITFKHGQANATTSTATQYYGGNLTPPSITAISGWTPLGWRDDTSAGAKEYGANNTTAFAYTSTTQTVYAVYSRTLTITYAANNGTGTAPSNTTTTQYYNANGAITSPSVTLATNPYTQSGCNFAHWLVSTSNTTVSSGGSYTWSIAVDATTVSRTATAQWNITVTATGVNTSYDGSAHSASISVAIAGTTVQYGTSTSYGNSLTATNANTSYNMSSVSVTNVADGTKTIYYKVSKSGYLDKTGSVTIKINARTVTWTAPTAASGTLTYDGNAKVLATIGSASAGGTMYYYVSDSATSPTFSTSTWKTTIDTKINAGTWYIHYYCYVSDINNNTGTDINTAAKISKVIAQANNPISVTATQSITGVNYNISTQDKSFTAATNAQGAVTYAVQSQKNSSDTTVNYFSIPTNTTATLRTAANTPAGTYTVVIRATAAGNTNYKSGYKDITITVTVTSYTVTITKGTGVASVTYKLGSGSVTTYSSAITVPVGQTVTYGATVSTGYTWWKWTGTHSSTTNAYSFTMTTSNVADTANAMQQVSVPTWKNSLTYDGSAQGATATTLWNNYSTTSLTIGGTTSGTNATSYNATFTPKSGYCWSDGTTTAKTVSWSIAQKEVSLIWGDTSWIYDGDEHSTTCTANNLISGDSCTVTLTNNSVGPNVGTTTVTASSLSNSNYKLPSAHTATLTISKRTITWAAPTVASGTLTYDGSAKVLASVGTASTGGTMYYYVNNSSTAPNFSTSTWKTTIDTKSAAGTWYVHYRCYVSDINNNEGSNINVTYTINKTINQREVTLTWGTVTWTYDGNTHSTTCTVGNLVSGDSCTVTLTGNSVGANVGTATVTASSLSNSNYKLPSTNTTTLTINRASVGAKPTTSVTKIYTGSSLNNNYTTPTGVNMTGDNNGIGVGTYSAVYTPDGNHKWSDNTTTAVTVTLTINNATLTVTAPNQSYTYDESAHGNAITVTTVGSQTPTIKYGTTSGSYTLTSAPQITNVADSKTIYYQVTAPNHTDKTGSYTLTITKRTVTPTAPTLTTGSLIYNGNAKTLANPGSCTTGGTMYYYVTTGSAPTFSKSTWNTSIDTQINAGTYNIYWYCCVDDVANNNDTSSDNINTVITLGSRTIGNATMTITATPYSDDYDGVAHSAQIKSSVASTTISYGISTNYGNSVTVGTSNVSMASVTRTNPGTTTVYYKASKANYNDVTGSTTITITGVPVHTKVGGVWKHGIVYVNVGGSWKKATTGYVKVNGTWKVIDK